MSPLTRLLASFIALMMAMGIGRLSGKAYTLFAPFVGKPQGVTG